MYSFASNIKSYYNTINPAYLTGAVDVIVVEQPDGSLLSTPFHVRFGKYGVFYVAEKYVDITINGEKNKLKMKLGDNGVAYFVRETDGTTVVPEYLASSPFSSAPASPATSETVATCDKFVWRKSKFLFLPPCPRVSKSDTKIPSSQPIDRKPSSATLGKKAKMKLPFSSSIFSNRKIRSLPELSQLEDDGDNDRDTVSPTAAAAVIGETKPASPNANIIDDGAVSDSELDRTRKLSSDFQDDDTVWKWGEFPHSIIVDKDKKKAAKSAKASGSYWSRFFRRPTSKSKRYEVLENEEGGGLDETEKYFKTISKKSSSSATVSSATKDSSSLTLSKAADDNGNQISADNGRITSPSTLSEGSKSASPLTSLENKLENEDEMHSDTGEDADDEDDNPPLPTMLVNHNLPRQGCGNCDAHTEEEPIPMAPSPTMPMVKTSYIRSLRLSSDELKSLQLRYGANEARFTVKTPYQGTSWCSCHIYLFKYSDIIVISDIDGTITKSDVLGHVIAAIGGQWAHAGVAELFTRIKQNGYKMVYLSSRAIGQAYYTKSYLQKIVQGSKKLPDGPVLLSPTSVLMAFRKEVIERRPDEFKIACLSDLKSLFPVKYPFYAGFGNRDTDIKSYAAVDIPPERILIINPSGTVKRADGKGFSSTYSLMAMEMLDLLFPPLHSISSESPSNGENERISTKAKTSRRSAPPETMKDENTNYEKKNKNKDDKKRAKWYRRSH